MRFDHDGMSLWYGTSDAPAPGETVHAGAAITIDVGVQPTDASNRVDVLYRVNDGAVQTVPAKWIRNNVSTNAQYHRVYLPPYRPGGRGMRQASLARWKAGRRAAPAAEHDGEAFRLRRTDVRIQLVERR